MTPREAFLRACAWDVAVRKPGNVSRASPGHGMDADQFVASAEAAAGPLCEPGAPLGRRIERAVEASWAAAGCNTNLGIVLLCAPLAAAAERLEAEPGAAGPSGMPAWVAALEGVLGAMDRDDAAAAYRAIARANPGGLGRVDAEDVSEPPSLGLRDAMALAAPRDRIARQYRDGFAELFDAVTPALAAAVRSVGEAPPVAAVQRLYLGWLASAPDSHIVRKHGEAVAHSVIAEAQRWQARASAGVVLDAEPGWAGWDESLKRRRINPGTSADLTVATLMWAACAAR